MTRMIPSALPAATTASEAEVFRLIRDAAGSQDYTCFHSLGIARHHRKEYAEADFVLLTPAGVFCLEVKGGEIRRKDGIWHIGWPGKSYTSVEGPFKQAQGARWALLEYLKGQLNPNIRRDMLIGWGVIFPDVCFSERDPEWDAEVVYDQSDKCSSFVNYVKRLEAYFRARREDTGQGLPRPLSAAGRQQIIEAVRGDFDVVPSLRGLLLESERELFALSAEQHKVLDLALNEDNPRILCDGGAGTGKTLVAIEAARRLAAEGLTVLLLCYNDNLGRFLKLDIAETHSRVRVSTVHSFLGETIARGGYGEELRGVRCDTEGNQLFDDVYPELFTSACARLLEEDAFPQFDVLVIDEAQDVLNTITMDCLDLAIARGFVNGRWLIFYDSGAQSALYGKMDGRLLERLRSFGPASFRLTENFRNPKAVVAEACVMAGVPMPACRRELVSPVDYRLVGDDRDQGKKLRALLVELIGEGVSPGQVTILSPKKTADACVSRYPPDVGKSFQRVGAEAAGHSNDAFTFGTIAGFKGLENDIIVLTDLSSEIGAERSRAALHIGMTRARTKLFAMVRQDYLVQRASL